ncbi:MAG: UDP-N-acetylmuramate dehydrogenase [Xanthomonadales bacterium]|nr:UDP-N-acetylmuramate dehydrogenase [Xanthomonadales bacterium]
MKRRSDASLERLNTFGIAARAAELIEIEREEDIETLAAEAAFHPARDLVLGGGSNLLLVGDVPGRVILNRIPGRQLQRTDGGATVTLGAGEDWHAAVRWTLDQGLGGLENLSLIPGCCGAAPMQNIGAYGVELSEVLESVRAWDWHAGAWREFSSEECRFAYRDSRFKSEEPDRYFITRVGLRLRQNSALRLDYPGVREELAAAGATNPGPRDVSDAVIALRRRKLPDPAVTGNAGSFFKNPVVEAERAAALGEAHPGLPVYPAGDGHCKLSAAWLIEQCGWKGHRDRAAGVSERHALVLVNHGGAIGAELLMLAERIRASVQERFGISLETEPRICHFET